MGLISKFFKNTDNEDIQVFQSSLTAQQREDAIYKAHSINSSASEIDGVVENFVYSYAPTSALDALAQAKKRRVDFFMIGDSNQMMDGFGFEDGLKRALYNRFGQYASEIQNGSVTGSASSGAGEVFDSDSNNSYAYLPAGSSMSYNAYNGIVAKPYFDTDTGNFDTTANLRVHMRYGTFSSGSGSFTPFVRYEESPWSHVQTEATISTNTGVDGFTESSFDLVANEARTYALGVKWTKYSSGYDIQGPFLADLLRVENLDASSGISIHNYFGSGGYNLAMIYDAIESRIEQTQINYFAESRRLQISKGFNPIVVIYINSGFNDRNNAATSKGWRATTDGDSPEAFIDNLDALIKKFQDYWQSQGWADNELYFLLCPSHPISNPDDTEIASYRKAIASTFGNTRNCSVVDFENITSYQEMYDNSWYKNRDTETIHLAQSGYINLSQKIVDLIPDIKE